MKKIISLFLATLMVITILPTAAFGAQSVKNAQTLVLGKSYHFPETGKTVSKTQFFAFTPTVTAYYEVDVKNYGCKTSSGSSVEAYACFCDIDGQDYEIISTGANLTSSKNSGKFGCKLEAKKTVYVVFLIQTDNNYSFDIKVATHTHTLTSFSYPAYTDAQDSTMNYNGGSGKKCAVCGYMEFNQTYIAAKSMKLSQSKYVYDKTEKKPSVTVYDMNGNVVSSSKYNVSYSNNIYPGKATVTVTFKDSNYSGSLVKTFKIKPAKQTIKSLTSTKKNTATLVWTKYASSSGYEIKYSQNKNLTSSKTISVSSCNTTSKSFSSLTGGKTYYFRVRSYKVVGKTKIYGAWSKKKAVKIKKK